MHKLKDFFKKNLFLSIFLFLFASFICVYFVWAYNPGTNIRICTGSVDQPSCYHGAYPTPTLNWYKQSGTSNQQKFQIQIDNNSDYGSPEIDSGTIISTAESYTVSTTGLNFNSLYYWRVRIEDNFGSWTGWAQGADTLFLTAGPCNNSPTASNLSYTSEYCVDPSFYFSWIYSDNDNDNQIRFQMQADNNSNFSSPTVDIDVTGLSNPSPTTNNQTIPISESPDTPGSDQLAYNTNYYWRVKVWDDQGGDSGWVNGTPFSTSLHKWPTINFNWSPECPSKEENVQFNDQSTVYGGASKSSWSWTFEDGSPASSSSQNPANIQFSSFGEKVVTLEVADSDGYTCLGSKNVYINIGLPDWEEILPW